MTSLRLAFVVLTGLGLLLLVHQLFKGGIPSQAASSEFENPPPKDGVGIFVRAELGGEAAYLLLAAASLLLAYFGADYLLARREWLDVASTGVVGLILLALIRRFPQCKPVFVSQLGLRSVVVWTLILLAAIRLGAFAIPDSEATYVTNHRSLISSALSLLIFAPLIEEVSFRWLLFGSLRSRLSFLPAAVLSSLGFAATHFTSTPDSIFLAWFGFVMAFGQEHTRAILPLVLAHVLYNLEVFGLMAVT